MFTYAVSSLIILLHNWLSTVISDSVFQIKTVPVLVVMKNGKVEDRLVGLQDTDKLHKFIDKVISAKWVS